MRNLHALGLALAVLVFAGCGSDRGPEVPILIRELALVDRQQRTLRIATVWDMVNDRVTIYRDPQVTHLVEVDILAGPEQGTRQAWPWDGYLMRRQPPREGTTLIVAPSEWVAQPSAAPPRRRSWSGNP